MRRHPRPGHAAMLALALAALAGCAAGNAYRKGQSEGKKGNWDLAVAKFTLALQKDPDNIPYKIALEKAKVEASRLHYAEARKHLAADDLELAVDELEIASKYDPGNKAVTDELVLVRQRIERREEQKRRLADFERMKARAQARLPVPTLSPRSPVPITLRFGTGTKIQKVLDTLGKLAGVNMLYDEGFRDKDVEVNLTGVTFEEALNQITFTNRLFYKVVDQNSLIIVPESPQKRRNYEEAILRTFYLQNAETTEVINLIKTMAQIQKVQENKSLGAITLLASPDKVALAERIIEANDKAKGEVVVEVKVLEVDKTRAREYGIRLSQYEVGAAFQPTGNEADGDTTSIRAHLLSSLNLADWVVTVPQRIFAKFLESEGSTRILASPRLRAAEGKPTTLRIGEEIPIPVTSFVSPTTTPGQNFGNATSFQYRNVGINLELTPKVNANGDISLDFNAEFSILGTPRDVGGGLSIPSVTTRNVKGTLRLRDGETSLIGGLVSAQELTSRAGALGIERIPLLNRIFGQTRKTRDDIEVLISITPHVVRAPKITEEDLEAFAAGTEEVVRVPSARPPLFGAPEPEAEPDAAPTGSPEAPPGSEGAAPMAPAGPPPAPPGEEEPAPSTQGSVTSLAPPGTPPPAAPATAPPDTAPPAAPAEGPITALFSPPEVGVSAKGTGTLAIVLVGVRDLRMVDATITYDAGVVQAVDASPGSLLTLDGSSVSSQKALEAGTVRVRFSRPTGASGSGVVIALTFKGVAAGTANVAIESLALQTGAGSRVVPAPAPGRIVVTP